MVEYHVRAAVPEDAAAVAADLRRADRAELEALGATDMHRVIADSIEHSRRAWTTTLNGRVLCTGGVAPLRAHLAFEDVGVPWMLGVEELFDHRRALILMPGSYIQQMLVEFPRLVNFVHAENHQSVRWLRRLGFTLQEPAPHGPHGALFHRFEMISRV